MDKLYAELQRLYFLAGNGSRDLVGPGGKTRALIVTFERAADWEHLAKLYEGVQTDLELPPPAIAVSGKDGYQAWFSLAEPVPVEEARTFLDALRRQYLAEIPATRLDLLPAAVKMVPALDETTGKWSAFIDPAMGSMFVDEPGLDMAPNLDKQADLLAGFDSIKADDFRRALDALRPRADAAAGEAVAARPTLAIGGGFTDPKSFLLAVMNDPSASADQRIEAAKALLPYFGKAAG